MKKVPREKAFYFFTSIGNYIGEKASSIEEFLEKIKEIDIRSLEFHTSRGDFEKWFRDVWGFEELAEKIGHVRKLNIKGESLRLHLYNALVEYIKREKRKFSLSFFL